jgi:glycosyltransferase involved in cell wall biosynthesis
MFVSGFTFIKNAVKYDYPIVAAIESILPLCDEVIVAVGKSEDNTKAIIAGLNEPKIRIIDTIWDENLRQGGRVLAEETNKALNAISKKTDWAVYIQGDECMHEKDYATIRAAMKHYLNKPEIEGLLFHYRHFYGSYDYVATSRKWYRNEIRVVRPCQGLQSYRDAQGFRIVDRKLNVAAIAATVYHYGWVKHPEKQQLKQQDFNKLWHDDKWITKNVKAVDMFDYSEIDRVELFNGSQPIAIQASITSKNWDINLDTQKDHRPFKHRFIDFLEKLLKKPLWRYQNYKVISFFPSKTR